MALLVMAQNVLLSVLVFLHLPDWHSADFQALVSHPLLALALGCAATPVCEEIFFRGVLLQGLLRNYRPAVAVAESALLFGVFHFNPVQSVRGISGRLADWLGLLPHPFALVMYLPARAEQSASLWYYTASGLAE
ncbi:MAG: CPBP family intramembrane glutamic endopeptidase [Hymenobacter sp.]